MQTFTDVTIQESQARGIQRGRYDEPEIIAGHIDGPVLHFSDGQMHWLTLWERILYRVGLTDANKLQLKLRPRMCRSGIPG